MATGFGPRRAQAATALTLAMLWVAAAPLYADGPGGLTGGEQASDGVLYSVNQITGELITIDPNTAAIGVVGPTGYNLVEGLTYHAPTDSLLAVDNNANQLIAINRYTGAGAPVGPIGHDFVFGLTYNEQSDTLYGVDTLSDDLLRLDPATGAADVLGPLGFDFVGGLTDDPASSGVFGVDYGSDQVFRVFYDEMGFGLIAPIVDVPDTSMQGVAFDATTGELFALGIEVGPEDLLRIDPVTDAVSVVGQLNNVSLASLEFVPNSVPEPTSVAMAVVGSFTILRGVRRRMARR